MTPRTCTSCTSAAGTARSARGQATILLIGGLAGILIATVIVGAVARAVGKEAAAQRAADLAAVAAARVMHDNYGRLFEPAYIRRRPNPNHLEKADYLALGRPRGLRVAAANGAAAGDGQLPRRGHDRPRPRARRDPRDRRASGSATRGVRRPSPSSPRPSSARPRTSRSPPAAATTARSRPARASGCAPTSRSRSTAWRRPPAPTASRWSSTAATAPTPNRPSSGPEHPDPKWVARPGTSLHRNGTELDLGPPSAYAWLAANATRFHFLQRYAWEPGISGSRLNPASRPTAGDRRRAMQRRATARPACRTARCRGSCRPASPRCCARRRCAGTSPRSCSPRSSMPSRGSTRSRSRSAGAQGIAQFMPATARGDGARRIRSTPSRRSTRRRT